MVKTLMSVFWIGCLVIAVGIVINPGHAAEKGDLVLFTTQGRAYVSPRLHPSLTRVLRDKDANANMTELLDIAEREEHNCTQTIALVTEAVRSDEGARRALWAGLLLIAVQCSDQHSVDQAEKAAAARLEQEASEELNKREYRAKRSEI